MDNNIISKEEKKEHIKDKFKCKCGNDTFRVYATVVIDDARLYCSKCSKELKY